MKYTLLKEARFPDPEKGKIFPCDLLIEKEEESGKGRIAAMRRQISSEEVKKLTGENPVSLLPSRKMTVLPALTDLNCHLGDPGYPQREDTESGTRAAVWGGYGNIVSLPDTLPVTDRAPVVRQIREKAGRIGLCRVLPIASLTIGRQGRVPVDFAALREAGAVAFSDDGMPLTDLSLLRQILLTGKEEDFLVMLDCSDRSLARDGAVGEGKMSSFLKAGGIPKSAETVRLAQGIMLAWETGCRVHFSHISLKESVSLLRFAKSEGIRVTADTCPHYFAFTEDDLVYYGTNAKTLPPLRRREDVEAVIGGLRDGTIDAVSSGHTPRTKNEKGKAFGSGEFGVSSLQTALPAGLTYLVRTGWIDLPSLVRLYAEKPAKILGLAENGTGRLKEGGPADLVLVDTEKEILVTESFLKGKSTNTPFLGLTLFGRVEGVFLDGERRV